MLRHEVLIDPPRMQPQIELLLDYLSKRRTVATTAIAGRRAARRFCRF